MSTKFTSHTPEDRVEKPLGLLLIDANLWFSRFVQTALQKRGYELNNSEFFFLANLDYGETHASSVARRMGISRQAVYRTTRDLGTRGLLVLEDDPDKGNQKTIVMTQSGKEFVSVARTCLAEAEEELGRRIGTEHLNALSDALSKPWA